MKKARSRVRGEQFDVFDVAGRKLGTFPTLKAAMRAPARAANLHSMVSS